MMSRRIRYADEKVVESFSGFATTTHVNLLGYRLTKDQLEEGARQAPTRPFLYVGHDTDNLPIGKIVKAEVRRLEDGEYGLWIEVRVYDKSAAEGMRVHGGLSVGLRTGPLEEFD